MYGTLLQSSIVDDFAIWALTFAFGSLVSWLVWLTLRHFNYALPAYRRLFGNDADKTNEGHLVSAQEQFNQLNEAHVELREEVDDLSDDVDHVDRTQEKVLANQGRIADALDVDLTGHHHYRHEGNNHDHSDDD